MYKKPLAASKSCYILHWKSYNACLVHMVVEPSPSPRLQSKRDSIKVNPSVKNNYRGS